MPSILDIFRRKAASPTMNGGMPPMISPAYPLIGSYSNGFFQGVSRMFRARARSEYLEEYRGNVYSCVNAIGEDVASIQLRLYKGAGPKDPNKVEIFDAPVLDLLRRVNDVMTGQDLFFNIQASLELDGNAFLYLARDTSGNVMSVWPLRPDYVDPIPGKDRWIDCYLYRMSGKSYQVPPENILHFKTYNPLYPYRGMGTVSAAMASIDSQNSIKAWNQAFFDNGARPDTIIEYSGNLADAERKRLQREWDDQYKGPTKAHRASFLGNGLKVIPLDVSQKEMDFVEQNRLTRDEILSIFRVPQSVLGITEDMTFANAETTNYVFALRTVKPKMQKIVNTLNEFFLPMVGMPDGFFFDFEDPVPQNQELKLQRYQNGIANGWLTPNEVRKQEGLPPVSGGDAVLVPSMMVQGGEVIDAPKPAPKFAKAVTVESAIKNIAAELTAMAMPAIKAMAAGTAFEDRGKAWNTKQRESGDTGINAMKTVMTEFFADQKTRVSDAVKAEMTKAMRRKVNKAISVGDVFDAGSEKQKLIDAVLSTLKAVVKKEGDDALALTGSDADFDENAKNVTAALAKQLKKFAGKVTDDTSKAIRDSIAEGLANDETAADLVDRIQSLASFDDSRAETIARTEVTRAQGNADIEAWDQSGVVTKKIWYTADDERVCEFCNSLHGVEAELRSTFFDKGDTVEGDDGGTFDSDYGPVDGPPLHPNCRCSILPVVE